MKKRIAVVTKTEMISSSVRRDILAAIENDGGFSLSVLPDAGKITDESVVLVFGGDGTVLEAIRAIDGKDLPLLCVNLGNLGFLAEYEKDVSANQVVCALKNGKVTEKMLLCVKAGDFCERALNEVVVKSLTSRPIYVDVYVDGVFVDSYHSDGAIVSSPTGSTAYSLSAGGPILAPDVEAFVINPICAHSLHSRPLVVSAGSKVELRLKSDCAGVCVDGKSSFALQNGDVVCVSKSQKSAKFIRTRDEDFYKKLLQKMNRWGTTECTEG